jgi:hypothetical protein|tara:strand:+ start:874 stop:1062 length:189 start_codon:yes stop_codon:yes gene_type:complete
MSVTKAQYVHDLDGKNTSIQATIDGKVYGIPLNERNRHYKQVMEWAEKDGNLILDGPYKDSE